MAEHRKCLTIQTFLALVAADIWVVVVAVVVIAFWFVALGRRPLDCQRSGPSHVDAAIVLRGRSSRKKFRIAGAINLFAAECC